MKLRRGIFTGENGSMGLVNGNMYRLGIFNKDYKGEEHIWIAVFDKGGMLCPYKNKLLLLENWMIDRGIE